MTRGPAMVLGAPRTTTVGVPPTTTITTWNVLVDGAVDDNFYIEHNSDDGRYRVNDEVLPGAFDVREWSTLADATEGFLAALARGQRAFNKVTGSPIVGTLERIEARANVIDDSWRRDEDGKLTFEHTGGSDVFWDSMRQQEDDDGPLFLDEDGEQVAEQDIELRPAFPPAG